MMLLNQKSASPPSQQPLHVCGGHHLHCSTWVCGVVLHA